VRSQLEALRGHQGPSLVIRGNKRHSEALRGHQGSSELIRAHRTPCAPSSSGLYLGAGSIARRPVSFESLQNLAQLASVIFFRRESNSGCAVLGTSGSIDALSRKRRSRACEWEHPKSASVSRPSVSRRSSARGHQRSSEAIRGHQRPSEVIRGHQRREAIREVTSEAIKSHQRKAIREANREVIIREVIGEVNKEVIRGVAIREVLREVIQGHQRQSSHLDVHERG
jgi:hypothetical protein